MELQSVFFFPPKLILKVEGIHTHYSKSSLLMSLLMHGAMGIIPEILFLCLECSFKNIYFGGEEQIELLRAFPH